ncbi:MAG: hypothetical protein LBB76_07985 [Azoarcus sp.]|nr:hypothetical protein [Azoarcus sp.]
MNRMTYRHGYGIHFPRLLPKLAKITERRTRLDWAHFIRDLVDKQYASAERVVLVMDNLDTHSTTLLYEAFPAGEALRLSKKDRPRDHRAIRH